MAADAFMTSVNQIDFTTMFQDYKIGIGIVTCNRSTMLKNLIKSLELSLGDEYIVVNDGDSDESWVESYDYVYELGEKRGVGAAKNIALQHLLNKKCDYLFIIEDDMLIKDVDVFDKYIKAHLATGIHHFMFAYHGPANKGGVSYGTPWPKKTLDYSKVYSEGPEITLNEHCVGAFCFYTNECLNAVGLMDENYNNAFEHVDHSYQLAKNGFSTPYWWWADIANSTDYIVEQACSSENSTISCRDDWKPNVQKAWRYFEEKNGVGPTSVNNQSMDDVLEFVKSICPGEDN